MTAMMVLTVLVVQVLAVAAAAPWAGVRTGDLIFVQPKRSAQSSLDAAILATGTATVQWLRANGVAVPPPAQVVDHVGIALVDAAGNLSIVQAVPPSVVVTPAAFFWAEAREVGATLYHGVVGGEAGSLAVRTAAARAAAGEAGKPYATDFGPPPRQFYCSSLVEFAFQAATGRGRVFVDRPFPLIFVPLPFWRRYYAAMNLSLPVGVDGSNPTLLLHSGVVTFVQVPTSSASGLPAGSRSERNHEQPAASMAAASMAAAAAAPEVTAGKVLLAVGKLADPGGGGVVLAIDPRAIGTDGTLAVKRLATTSLPPDTGTGTGFDRRDGTLYYEGWDDAAGRNAFVAVHTASGSSEATPRRDNVFDFEVDATSNLLGLSATAGNLTVGSVDRTTGAFTSMAVVDVPAHTELLMGSAFVPVPGGGAGGTFVFLAVLPDTGECVIVSAPLGRAAGRTAVSPPVQGLAGPAALFSVALLPPAANGGGGGGAVSTVVGIGQAETDPASYAVLQLDRATAAHVRPPRPLTPGPPKGASIVPVYALDTDARVLHQLFELACAAPPCPVCVLSVEVGTGRHGRCAPLPRDYLYLAMHGTAVAL